MNTLLLDIETAPHRVYTWGLWNQNVGLNQIEEPGYTLCWAAKWLGNKEVMFSSIHSDGNQDMLAGIHELISMADVVVHYNGTKFDMPILNQEFLQAGFPPPSPVIHVDLLKTARKRFRLPSNKLSYVANQFLGLGDKVKHKGMDLWRECMSGNDKSWREMERYNKQDVVLLERVYNKLLPWIPNHPNHGLFTSDEDMVCPNCGGKHLQRRGHYYTKTMKYQRYHCQTCNAWSRARVNDVAKEKRANITVGVE